MIQYTCCSMPDVVMSRMLGWTHAHCACGPDASSTSPVTETGTAYAAAPAGHGWSRTWRQRAGLGIAQTSDVSGGVHAWLGMAGWHAP